MITNEKDLLELQLKIIELDKIEERILSPLLFNLLRKINKDESKINFYSDCIYAGEILNYIGKSKNIIIDLLELFSSLEEKEKNETN